MASSKTILSDTTQYQEQLLSIITDVKDILHTKKKGINQKQLQSILKKHPKDGTHLFSRGHLVTAYHELVKAGKLSADQGLLSALKMKPIRTISGVTPVTVLTKPFPCPGTCIFCPNDVRMPKSYLADEPGAMRAERNKFDPYLQAYNRLQAFQNTGHNVEKVELIILGGTWTSYPRSYQIWFVKRLYDALNDFGVRDARDQVKVENVFEGKTNPGEKEGKLKTYNELVSEITVKEGKKFISEHEQATYEELEQAHKDNETAKCRNVGLVIETRPDEITEEQLIHIRRLGATKVQLGIQSLDDEVLAMNKRGHDVEKTREAFSLIRLGGFKIHGHWMANLYGSTPEKDVKDYQKLWGPSFCPDELKLYPCSVIPNTELSQYYHQGKFKPYTKDELLHVLSSTIPETPRYVRLTRIIRDIPSTDIEAGNKITNFRELAEAHITSQGRKLQDIRSREVKEKDLTLEELELEEIRYETSVSTELFLSYKTKTDDKIAAFLRLSFPKEPYCSNNYFHELRGCAMIREVHVYGTVVGLGKEDEAKAQHKGLGTRLTELACEKSKEEGYKNLAVISAIGTREYYRERRFFDKGLYLIRNLVD